MSVLHIIPGNTEVIYPFISMIEYELPTAEQHLFLITEMKDIVIKKAPLLLVSKNTIFSATADFGSLAIQKHLKDASAILWHSFSGSNSFCLDWLLSNRKFWNKSTWVIWDEELRQLEYHDDIKNNNKKFYESAKAICKHIRVAVQNEFSKIIAKYLLDIGDTIFVSPYPWERTRIRSVLNFQLNDIRPNRSVRLLQVGYSGLAINYHDKLFPILNEMNYQYHYTVPINFNDHHVEKQVSKWYQDFIKKRREMYPNLKIYLLSKQVNQQQYMYYLSQLDGIVVYKYYATCFPLLVYAAVIGFPVFFVESNAVYLSLKQKHFPVYLVQDLEKLDVILNSDEEAKKQFKVWAQEIVNLSYIGESWKSLFKAIL